MLVILTFKMLFVISKIIYKKTKRIIELLSANRILVCNFKLLEKQRKIFDCKVKFYKTIIILKNSALIISI